MYCALTLINIKFKYITVNKIMSVPTLKFVFENRACEEVSHERIEFFSFGFTGYEIWIGYDVTHGFCIHSDHIAKYLGL